MQALTGLEGRLVNEPGGLDPIFVLVLAVVVVVVVIVVVVVKANSAPAFLWSY
jgi:hypothetical protein